MEQADQIKVDECDKKVQAMLDRYGFMLLPIPYISAEGKIEARMMYFKKPEPPKEASAIKA